MSDRSIPNGEGRGGGSLDECEGSSESATKALEDAFVGKVVWSFPEVALIGLRLDGTVFHWNGAAMNLYDYSSHEAIGRRLVELIVPEERQVDVSRQLEAAAITGKLPLSGVFHMSRRGGQQIKTYVDYTWADHPEHGALIFALHVDLSSHHKVESGDHRLIKATEQSPSLVVLTDADLIIEYVNERFCEVTGFCRNEVIGRTPGMLRHTDTNVAKYPEIMDFLQGGKTWNGELINRKSSGEPYWEQARISPIRNERGQITHYIKVAEDISERKALFDKLNYLAYHDPMTGLANREAATERMEQALAHAEREGKAAAVLFLDMDGLKWINDTYGHKHGDRILVEVAARLRKMVRRSDCVARLSGDEFLVLLTGLDRPLDVVPIVEKLTASLTEPVELCGNSVAPAVSIGISLYPHDSRTSEELVRCADTAMYQAKSLGQGGYQFYTRDIDHSLNNHHEQAQALRHGLVEKEFFLVYQPCVDLHTRRLERFEALVRWRHPRLGIVSPETFLPLARETGLMEVLGGHVLQQACDQLEAWQQRGLDPVPVALNLSDAELENPGLHERLLSNMREYHIKPQLLEFEVTESVIMRNMERTSEVLSKLSDFGLRISIDDFGTAFSSLRYLGELPVSSVKIDQYFISGLQDELSDSKQMAINRAIIRLGEALGLEVVAEGVESDYQCRFLIEEGCRLGQGFLFSLPLPAEEVEDYLRTRQV